MRLKSSSDRGKQVNFGGVVKELHNQLPQTLWHKTAVFLISGIFSELGIQEPFGLGILAQGLSCGCS